MWKDANGVVVDVLVVESAAAEQLLERLASSEFTYCASRAELLYGVREIDDLEAAVFREAAQRSAEFLCLDVGVFLDGCMGWVGERQADDRQARYRHRYTQAHEDPPASGEARYGRRQKVRRTHASRERSCMVIGQRSVKVF